MASEKTLFGYTSDKQSVYQYTLTNSKNELVIKAIDFGCIITNVFFKDASGEEKDVVLGFDSVEGYESKDNAYFGALVGRVANRIKGGTFVLNGRRVQLAKNASDGRNHLHGGIHGFDKKIWSVKGVTSNSITLCYESPDLDENYPAKLQVTVTYTITEDNEIALEYHAKVDPSSRLDTIVNLTNHTYFNLSGCSNEESSKILDHYLLFSKDSSLVGVLDKDDELVPNGNITKLDTPTGQPFNFFREATIGSKIDAAGGFDHAFIFDSQQVDWRKDILSVWSPKTKIALTMSTTEPSFQLYTGEFLSESLMSKKSQGDGKVRLGKRSAFCLEAQRYPDAINHEEWKTMVILHPEEEYQHKTVYQFKLQN